MIAYEALLNADYDGKLTPRTKDILDKYSYLEKADRSFLKRLIEGTIERMITIDYVLDLYSKVPVRKMKKQVRWLLRMGVCQLLYMDVADFAAVNETVKIAKKKGFNFLSGFVNGVLRTVSGQKHAIKLPDKSRDPVKHLSVKYSCPEWIVSKLINEQTDENAEALLELSVSVRSVTARVNLSKTVPEDAAGKCGHVSSLLPFAIVLDDYDNIPDIPAFANGNICIQDISSMLVCHVACIGKSDTILDLCAAPGGKALHAADIACNGKVTALDISEAKTEKIKENIARCGFTNIETGTGDATVYNERYRESADVVIADVPCSGLGVMGRKNDIKYNLSPDSIDSLVAMQRDILSNAVRYVREGGTLMFCTCTCSESENAGNMRYLIDECQMKPVDFYELLPEKLRDDTARDGYIQLYGKDKLTDGFFIAKFVK